jgi:hypothetical protein
VCAKAGNGFVARENCFVGRGSTKHWAEKPNDFSADENGERA